LAVYSTDYVLVWLECFSFKRIR